MNLYERLNEDTKQNLLDGKENNSLLDLRITDEVRLLKLETCYKVVAYSRQTTETDFLQKLNNQFKILSD